MSLATEVGALRNSAGLSHASHVAIVRVEGAGALEFLQTASTQSPYVREGRVRHTLFLKDDGSVFADAFMVNVSEGFFVLAEGPGEDEIVLWLTSVKDRSPAHAGVAIRGMRSEWVAFGIDGPYAWEVVSGALGPSVLGMPYLSLMRRDDVLCVRAGKTGEYGYLLLVPRASAGEVEANLVRVGGPLDLAIVTRDALDVCALENWHFSMRTLRETNFVSKLTPVELQLQWGIVYTREFVGAEALRAHRAEAKARVTCFVAEGPIATGQRIELAGEHVGEVLAACASPTLGHTVGAALLELRFAHPHVTFRARDPDLPLRTVTASLVDNASLHVQPHKHSYATRLSQGNS